MRPGPRIIGYADRLSVPQGGLIAFKVSSAAEAPYAARLVRLLYADPNPAGPGARELDLGAVFSGNYPSRLQAVHTGSYGETGSADGFARLPAATVVVQIWPTLLDGSRQTIVGCCDGAGEPVLDIGLTDGGRLSVHLAGRPDAVVLDAGLRERSWYRVWLSFDCAARTLTLGCRSLETVHPQPGLRCATVEWSGASPFGDGCSFTFGAARCRGAVHAHYNGKIEGPRIVGRALSPRALAERRTTIEPSDLVADWDFSREMSSFAFHDLGPCGLHGRFLNAPARAVTGAGWTGDSLCWSACPEHYAAVHFHEDDLHDCGWETDFSLRVPADLPSGIYGIRLQVEQADDVIPFYVVPAAGTPRSPIAVVIPTYTYVAYGNHARGATDAAYMAKVQAWGARLHTPDNTPQFGLSTYNRHRDGSGICYASRLRPLLNLRPGYVTFDGPRAGSGVHHFGADFYLTSWLDRYGYAYDIVTDDELNDQGDEALSAYAVLMTTSHPEYHTRAGLGAIEGYLAGGGRLMYLGGNGFYWRAAVNADVPGLIEVRRNENGIRAWVTPPGEYYHSLDGAYGGLWRSNGRFPQKLVGVGFSGQGGFVGGSYRRTAQSYDPEVAELFAGVDGAVFGAVGFAGGGAAGYEVDRVDFSLGSPPETRILACAPCAHLGLDLVPEDILWNGRTVSGEPADDLVRADMVLFDTSSGGAVFSVGSITYTGALPVDDYRNDVSTLTRNVLKRFLRR